MNLAPNKFMSHFLSACILVLASISNLYSTSSIYPLSDTLARTYAWSGHGGSHVYDRDLLGRTGGRAGARVKGR